jgi:hypothetical protein
MDGAIYYLTVLLETLLSTTVRANENVGGIESGACTRRRTTDNPCEEIGGHGTRIGQTSNALDRGNMLATSYYLLVSGLGSQLDQIEGLKQPGSVFVRVGHGRDILPSPASPIRCGRRGRAALEWPPAPVTDDAKVQLRLCCVGTPLGEWRIEDRKSKIAHSDMAKLNTIAGRDRTAICGLLSRPITTTTARMTKQDYARHLHLHLPFKENPTTYAPCRHSLEHSSSEAVLAFPRMIFLPTSTTLRLFGFHPHFSVWARGRGGLTAFP